MEYSELIKKLINFPIGQADLAINYADPNARAGGPGAYIVAIPIDPSSIIDKSDEIEDMSDPDGSGWIGTHPELQSQIWTASGSAHGLGPAIGVYYGQPVDDYKIVDFIKSEDFVGRWRDVRAQMQAIEANPRLYDQL